MLKTTYKYRVSLTRTQRRLLEQQLEICRWVYNQTLALRKVAWEERKETLSAYDTNKFLPVWKTEHPELKQVYAQVLQNVQARVDLAFKAFFRRTKTGENPGYPRFKGKRRYDSITYPQYRKGMRLDGNRLTLAKFGTVQVKLHRPLEGQIKTVTLHRTSTDKYFVSFAVEKEQKQGLIIPEVAVGVDVGLEKFATFSTGETIPNPRFFRRDAKDLARAQRHLNKEGKGSSERNKWRKVGARIYERIANRRKNFAHQVSRSLVNRFRIIVFENLSISQMLKNHCLAKSIADAAWGQLAIYTRYKAEDAGSLYIEVDPRGTSQRCSKCGATVKKSLAVRVHKCPFCGLEIDRDLNAALNIKAVGLHSVGSPLEALAL